MPSFKSLLLLFVLATIGFFAWKKNQPPPKIVTPEEEVAICTGKNPIPAEDLVKIAEKHPKLLTAALKDRRIAVSGILKKAFVKGVDSNDLILDLQGDSSMCVSFSSDVNRNRLMHVTIDRPKFFKQGREILVKQIAQKTGRVNSIVPTTSQEPLTPNIGNLIKPKKSSNAQSPSGDTILFRELDSVKLDGIFQYITKGSIKMEWTPPMSF